MTQTGVEGGFLDDLCVKTSKGCVSEKQKYRDFLEIDKLYRNDYH